MVPQKGFEERSNLEGAERYWAAETQLYISTL